MDTSVKYNLQVFTPEEVEKGLDIEFVKFLKEMGSKSEEQYNEILITTDGECTLVYWTQVFYNDEDKLDGHFEYLSTSDHIYSERELPDGSIIEFPEEDDYDAYVEESKGIWREKKKNVDNSNNNKDK